MAKSTKRKPSFDGPGDREGASDTGWVYRSEPADASRPAVAPPIIDVPTQRPAAHAPDAALRDSAARQIVDRYVMFAAAAGLVPIPLLDTAAITGVQLAMLHALSDHYTVPFSRERGKAIVVALAGGVASAFSSKTVAKFLVSQLPVAGMLINAATEPALASAATYAVGRVFMSHFASGGTLDNLDVERSRGQMTPQPA
jgi:uncharacterized protein (DUF697 family)